MFFGYYKKLCKELRLAVGLAGNFAFRAFHLRNLDQGIQLVPPDIAIASKKCNIYEAGHPGLENPESISAIG